MSLTANDLAAIKSIVEDAINESDQRTAAGFAEVHEKLAAHDKHFERIDAHLERIDADLNRIENKLDATIDRVADHSVRLQRVEANPA